MRTTLAERIWAGPRPAHGARMLRGLLAAAGTCTVVLLAAGKAQAEIKVGTNPYAVAITPNGTKAYVTNDGSETVTPITTATNTAGAPIKVGKRPEAVVFTPDGSTAWVGNYESNTMTPITVSSD